MLDLSTVLNQTTLFFADEARGACGKGSRGPEQVLDRDGAVNAAQSASISVTDFSTRSPSSCSIR